jgi:hypothetical protein
MTKADVLALPWRRRLSLKGFSFRPTSDDWHPSFSPPEDRQGGEVGIAIIPLVSLSTSGVFKYRVFAIGETGHGLARDDFDLEQARAFVLNIPLVVQREYLVAQGFTHW